jgi:internalin A
LPSILVELTNLRKLSLFTNFITELPNEIGQLTNLEYLDLCNNQINQLPEEMRQLTNLKMLDLGSNTALIRTIPKKILKDRLNPQLIISTYLEFLEAKKNQDMVPINEGKIIFIGQGDVGKTTLRK